jgi:hypothetical protein
LFLPFCQLGVFNLLANGNPVSELDQAPQVFSGSFDWYSRQRHLGGASTVATGQSDAKISGCPLGVFIEHLVEIAHAEKEDGI